MAVYTKIKKYELVSFLKLYDLGRLVSYNGILDGIENTNFLVITEKGRFILTIFEKRVNPKDLPFFMKLQEHLSNNGFACPIPIYGINKKIVNSLSKKNAIIISFLSGKQIKSALPNHCLQVGQMVSNFQKINKSFNKFRKNKLSLNEWKKIFNKCLKIKNHKYLHLILPMKDELEFLNKSWPKKLPKGIIHADIFKDNVFFKNNRLSGLIDFYFSCNDYYAYELAIITNAWCFNKNGTFKKQNFKNLLSGYKKNNKLISNEIKNFNILLRGAAMRILVTRLHDQLFHPDGAIVIPKDPLEYYNILVWHQNNSVF